MTSFAEPLSGIDTFFLAAERQNSPMHIGATLSFEAAPLADASGGVDVDRLRDHVASRLHRVPRFRQQLAQAPLTRRILWVDDPHFDVDAHVRHLRVDPGLGERGLKEAVGEILSRPLDRDRPLWELWVVDGAGRNRFMVVSKIHHCMADGLAGVGHLCALLDSSPETTWEEPPPWLPRPHPRPLLLAVQELAVNLRHASEAAASVGAGLRAPSRSWQTARAEGIGLAEIGRSMLRPARSTPLNRPIGPERRFEWLAMSLGEIRLVKRHLGGTMNDVVLAATAGGLRRYLGGRGMRCGGGEVRAMVPVAIRDPAALSGNRISPWILPLPVEEPDGEAQLERIRSATSRLKESRCARGFYSLTRLADALGPTVLRAGVQLLGRLRPFNLVVTNVPGPRFPLYLGGARLVAAYPMVPLFENQGLGIAVFGYAETLFWGFLADPNVVPDLEELVYGVALSFCELLDKASGRDVARRESLDSQRLGDADVAGEGSARLRRRRVPPKLNHPATAVARSPRAAAGFARRRVAAADD